MKKIINKQLLAVLAIVMLAWMIVTIETPYGLATTPDSLSYLDVAANIHNGHGALATDFSLASLEKQAYVEQRLWPKLYPATLSLFVEKLSDVSRAVLLSKILFSLTLLLVYLILSHYLADMWPLLATLLFSITTPMITVYNYVWSETLFIPLMLFSAWLAIRYLDLSEQRPLQKNLLRFLLLLTLLGLFYTRYIGIVFFLLLPFVYVISRKEKNDLPVFIGMCCIYWGIAGYSLMDNYQITGSLSGGARAVSDKTLWQNLADCYAVLKIIVPSSWFINAAVLVAVVVMALLAAVAKIKTGTMVIHGNARNSLVIPVFFTVLYLCAIVAFRTSSSFDTLDLRLLSPAFPFIWILLCIGTAFFIQGRKATLIGFVVLAAACLLLPIKGYQQLLGAIDNWQKYGSPKHRMSLNGEYNNLTPVNNEESLKAIFSQFMSENGVVLASRPLIFQFMLDKKSIALPAPLDFAALDKINHLPAGSLLVFENNGVDPFALIKEKYTIKYSLQDLGDVVLVAIPVQITGK